MGDPVLLVVPVVHACPRLRLNHVEVSVVRVVVNGSLALMPAAMRDARSYGRCALHREEGTSGHGLSGLPAAAEAADPERHSQAG